jgi:hypothetical protein
MPDVDDELFPRRSDFSLSEAVEHWCRQQYVRRMFSSLKALQKDRLAAGTRVLPEII